MPISAAASLADHDPYSGQVITELSLATVDDVEAAYASATRAQHYG